jgi:hypothetical protein
MSALAYARCPDHIGSTSKISDNSATPTICIRRTTKKFRRNSENGTICHIKHQLTYH